MECINNLHCLNSLLPITNKSLLQYFTRLINNNIFFIDIKDKQHIEIIETIQMIGKYQHSELLSIIKLFNQSPKYCCPDKKVCRQDHNQCRDSGILDNSPSIKSLTKQEVLQLKKKEGLRPEEYCDDKNDCPKLSWRDEYKYICDSNRCSKIKNPKYNPHRRVNRFQSQTITSLTDKPLNVLKTIGANLKVENKVRDKRYKKLWVKAIKQVINK
tara:strand:- start:143 stop:784 length:642 start_codon:yes stop_codon:yes gene_type:complete